MVRVVARTVGVANGAGTSPQECSETGGTDDNGSMVPRSRKFSTRWKSSSENSAIEVGVFPRRSKVWRSGQRIGWAVLPGECSHAQLKSDELTLPGLGVA